MTDEMIIVEARKYPTDLIILTGGEPTLFADAALIEKLHEAGFKIAMETNGTRRIPNGIDFVTISPKFEFCQHAELAVKKCDELKVVYNGKNDMTLYENIEAHYKYIQPCDTGDEVVNKEIRQSSLEFVLRNSSWRLSIQTQKILDIR